MRGSRARSSAAPSAEPAGDGSASTVAGFAADATRSLDAPEARGGDEDADDLTLGTARPEGGAPHRGRPAAGPPYPSPSSSPRS